MIDRTPPVIFPRLFAIGYLHLLLGALLVPAFEAHADVMHDIAHLEQRWGEVN